MVKKIPTLSSSAWVGEVGEKADKAIAYFFVSDYSQSVAFSGNITSLSYIVQQYGNDALTLQSEMQRRVQTYMARLFDEATVEVSVTAVDLENDDGQLNINLKISVVDAGKRYSLARLIKTMNSKVQKIIDINNEGSEQ